MNYIESFNPYWQIMENSSRNFSGSSHRLFYWKTHPISFIFEICNHISVNIKIVVYWPIYDIEYWPIYEIFQKSFFDRYMSKFSFFDRYMKIFIFFKITIFGFYSLVGFIKTLYIDQYNNSYIGLYKNVYKTLGDLAYIDLYTPYRFAASRSYIDRYMLGHLVFCKVIISTDIWIIILNHIWRIEVGKLFTYIDQNM